MGAFSTIDGLHIIFTKIESFPLVCLCKIPEVKISSYYTRLLKQTLAIHTKYNLGIHIGFLTVKPNLGNEDMVTCQNLEYSAVIGASWLVITWHNNRLGYSRIEAYLMFQKKRMKMASLGGF